MLLSAHEGAQPLREPGSEELLWKMKSSTPMMPESLADTSWELRGTDVPGGTM